VSPDALAPPALRQLPLVGGLALLWVLLWGTWSWANVLGGIAVAVAITWVLPLPPVLEHARLRPWPVAVLLATFVRDLMVSSAQVSWLAVRRRPPRAAIVGVQLRSDSDLLLTLVTQTLNLLPGSMVLDVDRTTKSLLMHVLVVRDEREVEAHRADALRVEERITRAFGSAREVAALREPADPHPEPAP
jgi:multicomponent Na+:H+ antiporter subunit E